MAKQTNKQTNEQGPPCHSNRHHFMMKSGEE